MASKIIGCGGYLPSQVVYNSYFSDSLDTSDAWIQSRTGISQRYFAASDQKSSDLAIESSVKALEDAKIDPSEVDLVICCTTTPDNSFPSIASKVQSALNIGKAGSFDLQAVCSGFIYGLHVADALITAGKHNTILLTCAEKMSSLLDMQDRSTCILFGDGAGSVVLRKSADNSGVIDSILYSDGAYNDLLYTDGGVSTNGISGVIKMQGPHIFRHAVEKMSASAAEILKKNHMDINDVTYFIPHQANARILEAVSEQLNCSENQLVNTVGKHANCSAASIPLALYELRKNTTIKTGDIILFSAIGAGLTWGSAIIKW